MLQVPAQCLSDYLLEMKQDYGYTVVGAEQSTNSKSLKDYHMPAKTLLLLGWVQYVYMFVVLSSKAENLNFNIMWL